MNRKKELCRNFQRGSCQYGDRCKFLHATQQQQKRNPFGFGVQSGSQFSQQQKPNPFGFGVQNSSQSVAASDFGAKYQNQVKPFENKWTRFSPIAPSNAQPSRQTDSQPQVINHKCTDSESCKRQIAEDFKNERPLWKLTCYGHSKNRPCDIFGDVSYEELRASAYQDAKRGMSVQAIIDRERNLLSSKLAEFENLLRNPYLGPPNSSSSGPAFAAWQLPGMNISSPPVGIQNTVPITVSSFNQLGSTTNSGSNTSSFPPSNTLFGSPNPFQVSNQRPTGFGVGNAAFGNTGMFGSQQPSNQLEAFKPSNLNINKGAMNAGSNTSFPQVPLTHFGNSTNNQSNAPLNSSLSEAISAMDKNKANVLREIWLKEEWKAGEIPEDPPPDDLIL